MLSNSPDHLIALHFSVPVQEINGWIARDLNLSVFEWNTSEFSMQFNGVQDNKSFVDKWDVVMSRLERTGPHQSSHNQSSPSADMQPPPNKSPAVSRKALTKTLSPKE